MAKGFENRESSPEKAWRKPEEIERRMSSPSDEDKALFENIRKQQLVKNTSSFVNGTATQQLIKNTSSFINGTVTQQLIKNTSSLANSFSGSLATSEFMKSNFVNQQAFKALEASQSIAGSLAVSETMKSVVTIQQVLKESIKPHQSIVQSLAASESMSFNILSLNSFANQQLSNKLDTLKMSSPSDEIKALFENIRKQQETIMRPFVNGTITQQLLKDDLSFINGSATQQLIKNTSSLANSFAGFPDNSSIVRLPMSIVYLKIPTITKSMQSIFKATSEQVPFASTGLLKSLVETGQPEFSSGVIGTYSEIPKSYQRIFKEPERWKENLSTAAQGQIPVPEAVESSDPDVCFSSSFWDVLTLIERYLRSTIEKHLTELSGSNWIKTRVPGHLLKRWKERQESDRDAGRTVYSPVQYADFMDLATIIIQRDNWKEVFKLIFKSKEEIQISLQRLHPIRNSICHSRPLNKSDILTLANEANQILSALGLRFSLEVSPISSLLHLLH